MMPTLLGLALGSQSSARSRATRGIAYVLPLSISQKITEPSLERPTCLNRSSSDSIFSPPFCDGRICLGFVAFGSNHPRARLQVKFPDEIPVFRTWQWRGGWSALYIVIFNLRTVHSAINPP